MDLLDYEPVFEWEKEEITERQKSFLEKSGIDAAQICKGQASKIIDRVINRRNQGLATPKQVMCLERFGYRDVGQWPFELAKRKIDELAAVNWKKYRLFVKPEEFLWTQT